MARKKQGTEAVLDNPETDQQSMSPETATLEATEAPKIVKIRGEKMTGQALLDFLKANEGMPVEDLAYNAGYYTKTVNSETGETKTTPHKSEFFKALTEASTGVPLTSAKRSYSSRKPRNPVITVAKSGNCVVGGRHGSVAGFEPGSKVLVTAEAGRIILTPYEGSAADAEVETEEDDLDL